MKRRAFTLAEVLITLGIIGVIAGLTIPTLLQKKAELETTSKLKRAYSTLSSAYTLAVQENGTLDQWGLVAGGPGAAIILNKLEPYLKLVKNCGTGTGCFPTGLYKRLSGVDETNWDFNSGGFAKAQLADGTLLLIAMISTTCTTNRGNTPPLSSICAAMYLDINGFNGSNQLGVDTFEFAMTKNGLVPYGTQQESAGGGMRFDDSCKDKSTAYGQSCAAWVLYNENMDYLHCNNLSWDGPIKCQ